MININKDKINLLLSNKALLIQAALLLGLVLIIIAIGVMVFSSGKKEESSSEKPSISVTPRPTQALPNSISVFPKAGQERVGLFDPIIVTFRSPLSETERKNTTISTSPEVILLTSWSKDAKTLTASASSGFSSNKTYMAQLESPSVKYAWSFSTPKQDEVSTDDQAKIQSRGDRENAEYVEDIYTNYPWYNDFPLMRTDYFVYFNVDKKVFIAKIYSNDPATVNNYKTFIIAEMNSIGVNLNEYKIEWQIFKKQ